MPRHARLTFPNVPHHVVQRGNHRQAVFFERSDCLAYLHLLRECAAHHAIEIAAYCLMTNHVHLIAVPATADGLHRALKVVNGRHAQRINRMHDRRGHLWQDRFFSSPLDPDHFLNAVRYVELNPVRARIVSRAEDFDWSSAAAHCHMAGNRLVDARPSSALFRGIEDWAAWLAQGLPHGYLECFRRQASQNLPCGSEAFITQLECSAGRALRYRRPGRPARLRSGDEAREMEKVSVPFYEKRKGLRPLFSGRRRRSCRRRSRRARAARPAIPPRG
jgi:putative transposase